jgi:hypothetical protein
MLKDETKKKYDLKKMKKKKQINLDEFSKPRLISQIHNPLNSKFVLKKFNLMLKHEIEKNM